eukprot:9925461-Prorocentrum_lima.AAC.1
MTSSLVGSEMCIRDSPNGIQTRADQPQHKPTKTNLALGPKPFGSRSPSPVSYTHLTLPTICSV